MTATVIIPTYNYAHYIMRAVQSVLDQQGLTTKPEIIVIDDGSRDETKKVLDPFIKSGVLTYQYQENQGKASAIAKGIAMATGDIIFNLDADDYFLPGKLVKTFHIFEANPAVMHVASPARVMFEDGRPEYTEQVPLDLLGRVWDGQQLLNRFYTNKMLFGGGSTYAGRALAAKQIRWDPAIDMYADEWLLLQTLLRGSSYFLPNAASVWWVHGNNYSYSIGKGISQTTHRRLLNSSMAILSLLENSKYPSWLLKRYRFKHEHRVIMWLEAMKKKNIQAIFRFIRKGIFSGNKLRVLNRYHAFRRLFPSGWIEMFKQE